MKTLLYVFAILVMPFLGYTQNLSHKEVAMNRDENLLHAVKLSKPALNQNYLDEVIDIAAPSYINELAEKVSQFDIKSVRI